IKVASFTHFCSPLSSQTVNLLSLIPSLPPPPPTSSQTMASDSIRVQAEAHFPAVDNLLNCITSINHVEEPYLRKSLEVRLIRENDLPPVQKKFDDVKAKTELWTLKKADLETWTFEYIFAVIKCDWQRSHDEAISGIKKAKIAETEVKLELEATEEKIREVQSSIEKLAVDARSLDKYRENLVNLFSTIFENTNFLPDKGIQAEIEDLQAEVERLTTDTATLEKVLSLLHTADLSILAGIIEMRTRMDGGASQGIYFPDTAFESIKEARALYPELPAIPRPEQFFKNQKDEFGATFTPLQNFLWDVKKSVGELGVWAHERVVSNQKEACEKQIELGNRTDQWLAERRGILREAAGKA
ncbi:hypothetical protein BC936DRAFT_147067, partial [Jimgerdemannia flammicorona]